MYVQVNPSNEASTGKIGVDRLRKIPTSLQPVPSEKITVVMPAIYGSDRAFPARCTTSATPLCNDFDQTLEKMNLATITEICVTIKIKK